MKRSVFRVLALAAALAAVMGLTGCGQTPAVQYSLTISVSPAGSGSVTPASGSKYKQGTVVTLTATPATGYAFSSWNGPVIAKDGTYQIVMDKNQSVTANFTKLSCDVLTKVEPAGVGIVNVTVVPPATLKTTVQLGETVRLTAQATNPAYAFDHWEGALTGTGNPVTLTVNGPKSVTAVFAHRIVFGSEREGNSEIYVMNADGTNQTRLTNDPRYDTQAAWSPDGTKIAFYRFDSGVGTAQIWVMNALDGSGLTQLTDTGSAFTNRYPSWSPDGTKITFSRTDMLGTEEIWVMDSAGNNQTRLTSGAKDWCPDSSPDGTQVAFTSTRDGNYNIYVISAADGSGLTQLTTGTARKTEPHWSPDGTKIAFLSDEGGNNDVWVMNADGTNPIPLRNNLWDDNWPAWSPDGTKIVFSAADGSGNTDIYAVSAVDGTGLTRLTTDASYDAFPDW